MSPSTHIELESVVTGMTERAPGDSPSWNTALPKGWQALPLKRVAGPSFSNVDKKSYEDGIPVRLCNYTDVYYNDFITPSMDFMAATATPSEIRKFGLRNGDVIITKDSESWDDIAVPACVQQELKGVVCGYHLALLRPFPSTMNGRFLFRALQATGVRDQFFVAASGVTRFGLGQQAIGRALLPVPPVAVQDAIADFLDHKTAAIDVLIEKKERLLELLAERRAALIHRVVTRGIEPGVPMKDSCISWLGQIPAHWVAAPLYSRYSVQLGKMLDSSRQTGTAVAPYLRNADVQWDAINTSELKTMDFSAADRVKYRLVPGDILMCEGGANATIVGRSAIWHGELEECYYQKALHRIRRRREHEEPRFLFYLLWAAFSLGVFVADANANIFHLTAEKLRVLRFPFPEPAEQRQLAKFLDVRLASLTRMAESQLSQLDRLREYRQALITAAVTGQIDVTKPERVEVLA